MLRPHEILVPNDLGLQFDHEETGVTFLANAYDKAAALWRHAVAHDVRCPPVIADDSGLCVDALDGKPGVYSARFGSPDGGRTELPADERNALLLSRLEQVDDRSAHFVCCMVLLYDPDRFFVAQERWNGTIADEPSAGTGGFGYDPVFVASEVGRTAAELQAAEKNRLSHRGKAAAALAALITDR